MFSIRNLSIKSKLRLIIMVDGGRRIGAGHRGLGRLQLHRLAPGG